MVVFLNVPDGSELRLAYENYEKARRELQDAVYRDRMELDVVPQENDNAASGN